MCLVALYLGNLHFGDQGGFIVLVIQQADNIRHGNELFGVQGNSNGGCSSIGVDVVGNAVFIHANRGNDRDKAIVEQVLNQGGVHFFHVAHIAQVYITLAGAGDGVAVQTTQANAAALEQRNQILVDLTGQNLLHNAHGFFIGITQAVDKLGFLAHAVQHLVDGRAAAVYQHNAHTQQGQGDKVVHNGQFQFLVYHGIAAVFDHQGFAVIFLDVGRGFRKKQRHFLVFHKSLPKRKSSKIS